MKTEHEDISFVVLYVTLIRIEFVNHLRMWDTSRLSDRQIGLKLDSPVEYSG